jgi:hypothetical protein
VKAKIIKSYVSAWGQLADDLLNMVAPRLRMLLNSTIDDVFSRHKHGMLKQKVE